jgi:hypothetical protein
VAKKPYYRVTPQPNRVTERFGFKTQLPNGAVHQSETLFKRRSS